MVLRPHVSPAAWSISTDLSVTPRQAVYPAYDNPLSRPNRTRFLLRTPSATRTRSKSTDAPWTKMFGEPSHETNAVVPERSVPASSCDTSASYRVTRLDR